MGAEEIGYAMFARRCDLDGADPGLTELAWLDDGIRAFWIAEAEHVTDLIHRACIACHPSVVEAEQVDGQLDLLDGIPE